MVWGRYNVLIFVLVTTTIATKIDEAWVDINGLVKVKVNGVEGKICSVNWDDRDAEVLCRKVGKTKSKSYIKKGDSNVPTLIADVQCVGNETRLEDCSYSVVSENATCTPPNSSWNSAGTYCYDSYNEVTYSLEHVRYGRVRATRNGYERYLCSESHFSYSPARAVCRDMGYKSGETFESEDLSMSQNPSWWKNSFDCEGKEPLLGACARASWEDVMPPYYNENSCIYNTPAVLCHGAARLHTRQRSSSGVVGLYHDGEYRAICSDHFDSKAVAVVCNSLGFNRGYKAPSNSYRYYNYYLRIENVTCSGTEKSLDQCSYDYTTSTSCLGPATVACIDQTNPDSALPDGSTKIVNQRVLIKYHDIWGTICYDNWDDVDAKIVCQQHGFDDGQALQLSHDSMKPRWYKNVTCQSGTDQTLDTCDKDTDTGYCYYTFDAGAYCFNNTNVATFSFTDSESTKYGRLQITRDNITHYLCDLSGNFNYREMEFVCKQMGFIKGQEYVPLKTFVQGEYWSNDINCKNNVPSLDACTSGSWKEVTNDGSCQYNVPSIYCYGNVRLHSDFFNATGHIQVYKNDRYEYVCQNNFGSKQLNVVCNELGFQHNGRLLPVNAYRGFPTGYGNIPNGYSCSGNEKSILDCTSFDALPCNQPATVACFQSVEDKLAGTGQVMVSSDDVVLLMVDGVWGTICAGGFDDVSATVMCNQQGYEHGVSVIKSERYEKPMLTQSVNCTGSETNISDCQIDIVTDSGTMCSNDKRAGVRCFNSDDINQYRLVDGDGYRYGRLMVTRKNKTGYVCSQHSDVGYKDANVVCKQLGFSSGERYDMPEVQAPYGTRYWSNKLDCSSNEPNIDTCMKDEWTEIMHDGKDSCPYSVPSVFCYGQVRLHTKYLNTSGAVLVRHNDGWVTVCDDSFDDNAAKVVCGEIGFVRNEGKMLSTNSFYDSIVPYNWPPKILDINCTGNENFISECNFTYNETYGICNRYNYAVVSCTPDNTSTTIMPYTTPTYPNTTANSQLPLASTNQTRWLSDKRVSLFINGMWSGICNTEWDDVDANIFCKELGYEKGVALEKYEIPYQPRYRYNISCNGTESTILDCSYDTFDDNGTCQYIPDAAAYCYNSNALTEIRLVGGPKLNSGRVEVKRDNKWGWFCEEGFYTTKARIICKQLGYKSGDIYYIDTNETNPYMWRTNLRCQGSEPYLDACDNQVWRYESFYNSWCQSYPPAVFCYGEVRLHTGFDNKTGVVEVYIDDDYYSLCADDFPIENAKVVCRQLGFSSTAARILPSQSFGNQGRIVEMKYSCNGSESKLADCMWSNETCSSRYNQAVISCDSGPSQGSDGEIQIDSNGFVSISFYGIWGRICGVSWDNVAAQIVCKQMGYETGLAHIKYKYESDKPLWVNEVNCIGSEHAIKDCQFTTHLNSSCTYGPSAFAYCYNFSTAPTYSFTGGSTSNSGYVETSRDGETGYICESGEYRNYEADTACRSLGYVEGDYYHMDQLPFTANFWKSSFYCHNNEPVLHICSTDPWSYLSYTNDTYQYEREQCRRSPLSVFCYNKVRLHSKFRNSSGIVLQRRDNQKYSYCSDDVDINTASVLCKQVGFASARHIVPIDAYEHANNYQIGFQNLSCPSGAVKLDQCTSYFDLNGTCDGGALAVICDDGNLLPDDATRILEDGTVVISKYGVWGTISSVNWDDIDAKVVCKENGYDHGRAYSRYSMDKPRWMYNVSCTGAEAKLANCSHQTNGENNTEIYALNAAAYCYNQSDVGSYELENGNYGRLLTTREGMTGYVCDTGYVSRVDLAIACRTLGYEDGDIYPSPVLPYGTLFWSNRFVCDTGAPVLESCVRSDWFNQTDEKSCRYHETFSVYCYGKVRLNVKYRNNTGILLINDNSDKTFAVCSEGFDMISANVSCKEMGFSGVRRILPSNIFSNDYKIMYSDFNCTGDEASLLDCPHNQQGCNESHVVLECDDELSSMGNYTMITPHYNNYNYTPSYNNSDGYTPSYNNSDGYTPSYNNSDGYTPSYNNSDGYTPSYNNSDGYTPSYNNSDGYTPSYNKTGNTTNNSPSLSFIVSINNTAWERWNRRILLWENGTWTSICSDDWVDADASVACKALGYDNGVAEKKNDAFVQDLPKSMFNVSCEGNESRLQDCKHDRPGNQCNSYKDAAAFCYDSDDVTQIKLVDGERSNYGRVQVKRNGTWHYFCDQMWHNENTNAICKHLGYTYGKTYDMGILELSADTKVWRNRMDCKRGERVIDQCITTEWTEELYSNDCFHRFPTVFCYGLVRLSGVYNVSVGAVSVYNEDYHQTICADQFGKNEANVVCKELGFPLGGKTLPSSAIFEYITSKYTYTCTGNEAKLSDCNRDVGNCSSNDNVAIVACNDGNNTVPGNDGDVMVNSDGMALMFYHGLWGSICPNTWDAVDASVVCKQQGYLHSLAYSKYNSDQNIPRWVFDVDCTGTETTLQSCNLKFSDTNHSCHYSESAMVHCYNTSDIKYSLTGGGDNYGYVMMEKESVSGYTCNTKWGGENGADIVCKNLGFSSGESYPMPTLPGNSSFWSSPLDCSENTPLLELCTQEPWVYISENDSASYDHHRCKTSGFLSVYCYGEVRLSGQYNNASGIVLQTSGDEVSTYCSDDFTIDTAGLICKDLGFTNQARMLLPSFVFEHLARYPVRYSNVICPSGAKSFKECTADYNKRTNCSSGALAIACDDGSSLADNQIKMLNDGTLQISKNGIWGTISKFNYWSNEEAAKVACKGLGYKAGLSRVSLTLNSPRWMYDVECNGNETSIFDCQFNTSPTSNTIYSSDAGVYCYDPATALQVSLEHGHYGRVQLTRDGVTGYICSLGYDASSDVGQAVCVSKGYDEHIYYPYPAMSKDTVFWGNDYINCGMGAPILDACDQSTWINGTLNDEEFSKCQKNTISVRCKYWSSYTTKAPSANSTNLTSTEQPGSGSNSTKSSTEQPGNSSNSTKSSTEQPGSGPNSTKSSTEQPGSSSNSTKSSTDSSGSGPNSTKSTSKPSGGGTDPTNSNGNDGKDNPADGAPGSSAACLSGIKSSLLLIIVVVIIGNV